MTIKVEVVLPLGTVTSSPIDATKEGVLFAINNDPWIDFPLETGGTVCIPCEQIQKHGAITIFDL